MNNIKSSQEITEFVSDLSVKKAGYKAVTTRILAILAGVFIAIGGMSSSKVNILLKDSPFKSVVGALTFTIGIVLVLIAGAELFTGNVLVSVGYMDKKVSFKKLLINWSRVWFWNFVGSFLFALITYLTIKDNPTYTDYFKNLVVTKTSYGFMKALYLGILCNVLVDLSVWMSYASSYGIGKFFLSAFPIFIFVLMGYEHVVANMFYFSLGFLSGSDVSIGSAIINSFIPVTLGNIIGGLFISLSYHFAYKKN